MRTYAASTPGAPDRAAAPHRADVRAGAAPATAVPRRTHAAAAPDRTAAPEALPASIARPVGKLLGFDFGRVRIHRDDPGVAAAGASATTDGERIRFAPGQYRPDHPRGVGLIGHELAHVAQQRIGRHGRGRSAGGAGAEREAARAGDRVRRGLPASVRTPARGPQARMGFEFQGSHDVQNVIEYGYDLASGTPRWEPAARKSAKFHGRAGPPHVKLESDRGGAFEFVTHPYESARELLREVAEAVTLTRHIGSWSPVPGEPNHIRLAQNRYGDGPGQGYIHRGRHWSTMDQINQEKGEPEADAVRINLDDPDFWANPQVTEGVRLEEIEGFFAGNLAEEPAPEQASSVREYVDDTVTDADAAGAFAALPERSRRRVRGFLSVVTALLLYARRYRPGMEAVKEAFSILHRTSVSAIYASLGPREKRFVRRHAFADGSAFLASLGTTRSDPVFPRGYDTRRSIRRRREAGEPVEGPRVRGGLRGPTVGRWFDSIVHPQERIVVDDREREVRTTDVMSPVPWGSPSMGALGMDRAPDGTDSLVVLEVRNWGGRLRRIWMSHLMQEHSERLRRHEAAERDREAERERLRRSGRPIPTGLSLEIPAPAPPTDAPNSIPASIWHPWAEQRLADARRAGRGHNFRP